jgi:hypothetical protein
MVRDMSVSIPASELKGMFVEYIDRDWKFRIAKVRRVEKNFLTVLPRGHLKKCRVKREQVKFRVTPKTKQDIDWDK